MSTCNPGSWCKCRLRPTINGNKRLQFHEQDASADRACKMFFVCFRGCSAAAPLRQAQLQVCYFLIRRNTLHGQARWTVQKNLSRAICETLRYRSKLNQRVPAAPCCTFPLDE